MAELTSLASADPARYDTDKIANRYLEVYEPLLRPWRERAVALLELGVHRGGSLRLWRDYFARGRIVGLDVQCPDLGPDRDRIAVYSGYQQDTALLSRIAAEQAPEGFDIIIDDASHVAEPTRTSFWHLFDNHLKPGGLYAIEDWGAGYWDSWPDGRKYQPRSALATSVYRTLVRLKWLKAIPSDHHRYGLPGFIKELVDEQGYETLSKPGYGTKALRPSKFAELLVTGKIVFVRKTPAPQAAG